MAIFVNEDDPQDGFDHVDGHRSICLVVSPYAKRGEVLSSFASQTAVLHTMCRILGTRPINQMVAMAPLMTDCFTSTPDFTPYAKLANMIPLNEMNPGSEDVMSALGRRLARESAQIGFERPDQADEDALNRIIWHSVKGAARYPAEFAGSHGKGLKSRRLAHAPSGSIEPDGD
jgi:hypothetical protein